MNFSEYKNEIIAGVALIVLLLLLLNPFGFLMLNMSAMFLIALFSASVFAFAGLFWREEAEDERETSHQHAVGRFAYLLGVATLSIAVIVQSFLNALDPWLAGALGIMVLGKVVASVYYKRHH